MRSILIAAGVAFAVACLFTPVLIRVFSRLGLGQPIRDEAPPESHQRKRGTPTMGGLAILTAIWASYLTTTLFAELMLGGEGPTASGLLVLGLATALGAVGFTDDFLKLRRARNLGLNKRAKSAGQLIAAILFSAFSRCTSATPTVSLLVALSCRTSATSPRSHCRPCCSCCSASWSSLPGRMLST